MKIYLIYLIIIGKGDKAGILQIEFYDEEDLAEIARLFAEK